MIRFTAFYRGAVALPWLVFGVPVLINRWGVTWFGGPGTPYGQVAAVSMYFGAIPYGVLTLWAWWWIGGRTEARIRALMWRAPLLMTATFLVLMVPWGILARSLDAWWSLSVIGALMCLGIGYGYVAATVLLRKALSGYIE